MYLDEVAAVVKKHIPDGMLPDGNVDELLVLYAVLVRAKGTDVTQSDIHDAWTAWTAGRDRNHESLVPYEDLPDDIRDQDRVFASAVRSAALELQGRGHRTAGFGDILFPSGPPDPESEQPELLDLYRLMVESSEGLVSRRQGVNTFFLTINGALLTASGLILQSSDDLRLAALGISVLALAGALLSGAWRSLIKSFGQLNAGKFKVINTIERYLPAAIYAAEWEALGRGENPEVYRSFTSREIWVPNALLTLHCIAAAVALLIASGIVSIGFGAVS